MFIPESEEVKQHRAELQRKREITSTEQSVRRYLRKHRLYFHKSRGQRERRLLGDYWIEDSLGIMPILRHVNLEAIVKQIHARGDYAWRF